MKPFCGGDDLSVINPDAGGHILLEELNGAQVRWKSVPEVPGPEIDGKMQFPLLNAGINAPETWRIF